MARLACVDIPFFLLQVLFRLKPEWKGLPAAVVDRNEPTGRILSINESAREKGVRPGISYSQGLSLAGDLRASTVDSSLVTDAQREIVDVLCAFTPEVEPCRMRSGGPDDPGSFWLNVGGLQMLYPSLSLWTNEVIRALAEKGLHAVVAVGFTRFGSYIAARSRRKAIILSNERQEEELTRKAPLRVLPLSAEALRLLHRLGITTVGAFLDLPEAGVRKRFGHEAHEILLWAQRERLPIQPVAVREEARLVRRLDNPITNLLVLSAHVDELLGDLTRRVAARQKLIVSITMELAEGEVVRAREEIGPAAPTTDAGVLKGLSRLRLAEARFGGAIDRIIVSAREIEPIHSEGELFASPRHQAVEAGRRALALIRARFGNESVRRAVLRDEHLPEERFVWEATAEPLFPTAADRVAMSEQAQAGRTTAGGQRAAAGASPGLDRRFRVVRRRPKEPLPPAPVSASFRLLAGPFVMTGKWWIEEDRAEYYFARGSGGRLLWLSRNGENGAWMVQGLVD